MKENLLNGTVDPRATKQLASDLAINLINHIQMLS